MKKTLGALSAVALFAGSAHATLITGLSVQSADTGTNANMSPSDAIDGSGLSSYTIGAAHTNTWTHNWWSANASNPQITIDLEGNYSLNQIYIYNYNEGAGQIPRSLQNVQVWVAPAEDEGQLVKLNTNGSGTQDNGSGDFLLPAGPAASGYTGFNLDLTGVLNPQELNDVRLVRIQALDTYGSTGGLAEVMFDGGAPIPEPSSLALLGLGGLLIARRRRG